MQIGLKCDPNQISTDMSQSSCSGHSESLLNHSLRDTVILVTKVLSQIHTATSSAQGHHREQQSMDRHEINCLLALWREAYTGKAGRNLQNKIIYQQISGVGNPRY